MACIVIVSVFPPWVEVLETDYVNLQRSAGFSWISAPPTTDNREAGIEIDFQRLVLIWFCIGVTATGMIVASRIFEKTEVTQQLASTGNKQTTEQRINTTSNKPRPPRAHQRTLNHNSQTYMLGGGKTRKPRLGILLWILAAVVAIGVIKATVWKSIVEVHATSINNSD